MDLFRRIAVFALVAVFFSSEAMAATAATVLKVKGDVSYQRQGQISKVIQGDKLQEGDEIRTGFNGRLMLLMTGGKNKVVLGGDTAMKLERVGRRSNRNKGVTLDLKQGSVRSDIKERYSGVGGDSFEVTTPNAVAGVRGTIFSVSFDPRKRESILVTEKGAVAWRAGGREQSVVAGQFSAVRGRVMSAVQSIQSNPQLKKKIETLKRDAGAEGDSSQPSSSGTEASPSQSNATPSNGGGQARPGMTDVAVDGAGNVVVVEREDPRNRQKRGPASASGPDLGGPMDMPQGMGRGADFGMAPGFDGPVGMEAAPEYMRGDAPGANTPFERAERAGERGPASFDSLPAGENRNRGGMDAAMGMGPSMGMAPPMDDMFFGGPKNDEGHRAPRHMMPHQIDVVDTMMRPDRGGAAMDGIDFKRIGMDPARMDFQRVDDVNSMFILPPGGAMDPAAMPETGAMPYRPDGDPAFYEGAMDYPMENEGMYRDPAMANDPYMAGDPMLVSDPNFMDPNRFRDRIDSNLGGNGDPNFIAPDVLPPPPPNGEIRRAKGRYRIGR